MKIKLNLRTITGTLMCLAGTGHILMTPAVAVRDLSVYGWGTFPILIGAVLLMMGEWYNEDHKDRGNGRGYR